MEIVLRLIELIQTFSLEAYSTAFSTILAVYYLFNPVPEAADLDSFQCEMEAQIEQDFIERTARSIEPLGKEDQDKWHDLMKSRFDFAKTLLPRREKATQEEDWNFCQLSLFVNFRYPRIRLWYSENRKSINKRLRKVADEVLQIVEDDLLDAHSPETYVIDISEFVEVGSD